MSAVRSAMSFVTRCCNLLSVGWRVLFAVGCCLLCGDVCCCLMRVACVMCDGCKVLRVVW